MVVGHHKHPVKSSQVVTLGDKREPDGLPGQPIDFRQLSSPSNKDGAVPWPRNSIMQLAKQRIGNHLAGTSTCDDFQQESSRFSDEVVCTGCPVHKQRFPGGDEPVFPRLELRRHLAAVRARTVQRRQISHFRWIPCLVAWKFAHTYRDLRLVVGTLLNSDFDAMELKFSTMCMGSWRAVKLERTLQRKRSKWRALHRRRANGP